MPDAEAGGTKVEQASSQFLSATAWSPAMSVRTVGARSGEGVAKPGAGAGPEQTTPHPSAADRASNHVTVHLTGEGGIDGRLRVAVRGETVRATIVSDDRAMTDRLGSNIDELHQALRQRGFSDANVSVERPERSERTSDRASGETDRYYEDQERQDTERQRDRSRSERDGRHAGHADRNKGSER